MSEKRSRHLHRMGPPNHRRFGEPFAGLVTPFGSKVEYHPIFAKDLSMFRQFGKKVLLTIFLGCAIVGGRKMEIYLLAPPSLPCNALPMKCASHPRV